jgi:hypothetical protein
MLQDFSRDISPAFKLEIQTVLALCSILNTPRALTVKLLIEHGEWEQLVGLDIDPSDYEDVSNFADDYLITKVMSKSPNLPLGIDRQEAALDAFFNAELQCAFTNDRILNGPCPEWTHAFSRMINRILGPLEIDQLNELGSVTRLGPGATTGVRGVGSVRSDKFDLPLHLTRSLYPFFKSLIGESWWEHQAAPKVIMEGNKFTTVPKNAKTDRGICVEPTLNMSFQLGIGKYIARRLKRHSIDLSKQTNNQEFAARAHVDGLATIDIAQASDTLSWALILQYFPPRWAELFFLARSERTKLPDGSWHELEKLSSMGNGFTFELESLVFSALAFVIVPRSEHHNVTVFGDDIIIPAAYYDNYVNALNFLGFRVNSSKSFLAGNFFESCGSDYFKGKNVRPFYLRGAKENIPYALQIANALRLYAHRRGNSSFCDSRYRSLWLFLRKRVPSKWRNCPVPHQFGDAGLIVSREEAGSLRKPKGGCEGRMVRHVMIKSHTRMKTSHGVLLSALAQPDRYDEMGWSKYSGPLFLGLPLESNPTLGRFLSGVALGRFSYGREAVRGHLRDPVTRWSIISDWPTGYHWF